MTAQAISGVTYALEENNWNYDNFRLVFEPGAASAAFSYTAKQSDVVTYDIGLDGVYRFTETEVGTFAARGTWTAPDTFEIAYQLIGYSSAGTWTLTFDQNRINVIEDGVTGGYEYTGMKGALSR